MYSAGVDVGSTQTKTVLMDGDGSIVARCLINTGVNVQKAAERAYQEAPQQAGLQVESL